MRSTLFTVAAVLILAGCGSKEMKSAKMAMDSGDHATAIPILQAEVDRDSTNVEALVLLGRSYAAVNQPDNAIKVLEQALRQDPSDATKADLARIYAVKGRTYMKAGEQKSAFGWFDKADELTPGGFDVSLARGDAWQQLGYVERAREAYKNAVKRAPSDPLAAEQLKTIKAREEKSAALLAEGMPAYESRRWDQAIKKFEKAVEQNRDNKDAKFFLHLARGRRYYKKGSVSAVWDAIGEFGMAANIRGDAQEPIYYMAQAYEKKDKDDYASPIETYEKVIAMNPDSELATKSAKRIAYLKDRKSKLEKFWGKKKK